MISKRAHCGGGSGKGLLGESVTSNRTLTGTLSRALLIFLRGYLDTLSPFIDIIKLLYLIFSRNLSFLTFVTLAPRLPPTVGANSNHSDTFSSLISTQYASFFCCFYYVLACVGSRRGKDGPASYNQISLETLECEVLR